MSEKDDTVPSYKWTDLMWEWLLVKEAAVRGMNSLRKIPCDHFSLSSDIYFPIIRRRQPSVVFL
ncbi:hypothetical protein [Paenibacillus dakarensis]|uniref:hypothetical protein n=1 Tax=Paenibacillus dakarensis TaxID=1527293 RepID=UPI0006D52F4C|nr:hypothetical protein [Paenibacillus dakarensis]